MCQMLMRGTERQRQRETPLVCTPKLMSGCEELASLALPSPPLDGKLASRVVCAVAVVRTI